MRSASLVVPAVLDAPGPVVITSNKADGWAATAQLRAGEELHGSRKRIDSDADAIVESVRLVVERLAEDPALALRYVNQAGSGIDGSSP